MNPQHLNSRINPHRLKHRMPLNSPQFPTTVREFTEPIIGHDITLWQLEVINMVKPGLAHLLQLCVIIYIKVHLIFIFHKMVLNAQQNIKVYSKSCILIKNLYVPT